MNGKQFGLLLIVGLVVGWLGYGVVKKKSATWEQSTSSIGQKVLGDFDINEVGAVSIKTADDSVQLTKKDGKWVVVERGNYPANFDDISDLIYKSSELKVLQSQTVGASQWPRLELVAPGDGDKSGTLVEFSDNSGKSLAGFILGKQHFGQSASSAQFGGGSSPDGRYVKTAGESTSVALVNESFSDIEPDAGQWINKDFLKVTKIKAVTVTHTEETDSFSTSKESETASDVLLASADEAETFDKAKGSRVMGALGYPSFNDVMSKETDAAETGLDSPITAKVSTFEGFEYDIKIGKPELSEDYFVTFGVNATINEEREAVEDETDEDKVKAEAEFKEQVDKLKEKLTNEKRLEGWIYKVSKYTIDPLIFKKSELYEEKEDDAKAAASSPAGGLTPPLPPINFNDPLNPLTNPGQ